MANWEDLQGDSTDYSNHEESAGNSNQMLHDRANRGVNAENIQANRNQDLRTRSLRGVWGMVKDQRAREDQTQ